MCDGTFKDIDTVEEGDWVLSQDSKTGELGCKEVVDPYANPDRSIILVELAHPDGDVEVIETTDNHPFFVTDKGWTRVDALSVGDEVPSSDGRFLVVVGLTWTDRIETVYNFGVEGFHTYFVGESGAWVHNCFEQFKKVVDPLRKSGRRHLDAYKIEKKGGVVARKSDGTPFDHVTEVNQHLKGVKKRVEGLKRQLGHPNLSKSDRRAFERQLSEGSKLIDRARRYLQND